jgi:hypothetical protein
MLAIKNNAPPLEVGEEVHVRRKCFQTLMTWKLLVSRLCSTLSSSEDILRR